MDSAPTRPVIRYHGGKWRLAKWIIPYLPAHRRYVEPFMGACSVLMRKPRSHAEVVNDLDGSIVNLFQVMRDRGDELRHALRLTPFAREEFEMAWEPTEDSLESARRTIVRAFMGFGSAAATESRPNGRIMTGFRGISDRSGTTPAHDWVNYPECMEAMIQRLQGVVIENRAALEVIDRYDSPSTLFYLDPPYVMDTRADAEPDYRHEMTDADHTAMAEVLLRVKGKVVLSGYHSALYDRLYADWQRVEKDTYADGARARVEVLWMNFQPEGLLL